MKRSELRRRTELKRGAPLRRTKGLSRHSRLASVGQRAKARRPLLVAAYAAVDARSGGICEARVDHVCNGTAVEHHHLFTRNTRPDKVTDPNAIIHICRPCHDWAGANPAAAVEAGISKRAWME